MYLNAQLPSLRSQWGRPYHLWITQDFDEKGWFHLGKSKTLGRTHDVALYVQDPDGRFALMNHHTTPPGLQRAQGAGAAPGESFQHGVKRTAKEEIGLEVELQKFVLHVTLDARHAGDLATWETVAFSEAPTPGPEAVGKQVQWATASQLEELARRLREGGDGALAYRARLAESYLWALEHPLSIKEAGERMMAKIEASSAAKDPLVGHVRDFFWWAAEVHGLYGGAVGVRFLPDAMLLVGLNVHPMFRGRGIGHALVECAADRLQDHAFLDSLGPGIAKAAKGGLWVSADSSGYYMPSGFKTARPGHAPPSVIQALKAALREDKPVLHFAP